MTDRIGQKLGNYRLTRLLGRGGFAEVYLGEHPVLGTTVAIKILSHTRVAYVNGVAWSSGGQRIVSGSSDEMVQVWNASDGSNVFTYRGHSGPVTAVAWSPDGKWIASGSFDKTVQVWNTSDGSNIFTYRGHSDIVWSVAWSPDGKRIASGSSDNTVRVWQWSK